MEKSEEYKPALKDMCKTGGSMANPEPMTLRTTYSRLLHEIQFRATRNALMNYHEADRLGSQGAWFKVVTNILTAATASGLLVGIIQKGQVLSSRAGLAGIIGFPICSVVQFFDNFTSDLMPNFTQKAKKHVNAAAGWVSIAETARSERMRMDVDPKRSVDEVAKVYNSLVKQKASVASQILVPQATHHYFREHPELVVAAVKRRGDAYAQFVRLEKTEFPASTADREPVEVIYF